MDNKTAHIEIGRWKNIPRENRSCHLCNEETGNEFHFLFICNFPYLLNFRKKTSSRLLHNIPK